MHSNLPLVEPYGVSDTFVSGIADIEDLGDGNYRFTLYAKRRNSHNQTEERQVVAALIMTRDTVIRCIMQSAMSIDLPIATEVQKLTRDAMN